MKKISFVLLTVILSVATANAFQFPAPYVKTNPCDVPPVTYFGPYHGHEDVNNRTIESLPIEYVGSVSEGNRVRVFRKRYVMMSPFTYLFVSANSTAPCTLFYGDSQGYSFFDYKALDGINSFNFYPGSTWITLFEFRYPVDATGTVNLSIRAF
ncbi:hypothetical protein D0T53_09470 [Dysgonomonas sp. 216]|uniref:hypothetical protein n=1 Tax=Dysgonomonas sp. 216 TaxID=2302934 RepID=UPI0013D6BD62|nr:hypothetical protein [Dysgonomonas sp. 216]NDW19139.1 hypothetical protein [Dysgonomonas sp. 216]